MTFRATLPLALVISAGLLGSARGGAAPDLIVENHSQYELLEVRLHEGPTYLDSPNVLVAPLGQRGAVTLPLRGGDTYVTIIRVKVTDGDRIAFTTAYPIHAARGHYTLEVYEGEFRLQHEDEPEPAAAATAGCSIAR